MTGQQVARTLQYVATVPATDLPDFVSSAQKVLADGVIPDLEKEIQAYWSQTTKPTKKNP